MANLLCLPHVILRQEASVGRRMTKFGLATAVSCLALIAFFSGVSAASFALRAPTSPIPPALAAWSNFPVQASSRPLVLIDGDNVNAPVLGFPNGDTKLAYEDGTLVAPSRFPTGPHAAAGFPLVSAHTAFDALKTAATPGPPATAPLVVTSVALGAGVFATDRGRRTLPAWLFSFQGVANPAQVLAVSPRRLFAPPQPIVVQPSVLESSPTVGSATLARNHRSLTVGFAGAPEGTGPCQATYSLTVGASRTAVAAVVHAVTHYKADVGCLLQASFNRLTTTLRAPLGKRVVVDADSLTAVPVQSK
jgi:hypothetical protein